MESLRLMPPTPQIMRVAKEQGVLDGMVIPKGTLFYIPVSKLQHHRPQTQAIHLL